MERGDVWRGTADCPLGGGTGACRPRVGMTTYRAAGAEHKPDPSTYLCCECAEPWPCTLATEYLIVSTPDRLQLALRMWKELNQAIDVIGDLPPAELFRRFLRWVR